jgi:DNA polymerase delta subunit 2
MESSLRWQHLAPSAPDTLACYPYKDRDPFHLDACPDVYFAGCQPAFGSRVVELERRGAGAGAGGETTRTLAVSVPSFAATGTIVMVDLETLTCTPVTFGDGGAAR